MTIEPRHSPLFIRLFAWYARRLVRRSFGGLYVRGRLLAPGEPVIYLVNHSSWWDALTVFLLSRGETRMRHDALMSEEGLRRFPFFARLGAVTVPVDRSTRGMRALLAYVDEWSRKVRGALWIFPQGAVFHADRRPLGVQPGAARIAQRAAPCRVVPVALRYEFGEGQRPDVYVSIGEPMVIADRAPEASLAALLESEVDRLRDDLVAGRRDGFRADLAGRASVSDRWEAFRRLFTAPRSAPATPRPR
ncbi:MAG: lysophospholipid acyltransferase family protein [Deltaproteobacteria bacterium]